MMEDGGWADQDQDKRWKRDQTGSRPRVCRAQHMGRPASKVPKNDGLGLAEART